MYSGRGDLKNGSWGKKSSDTVVLVCLPVCASGVWRMLSVRGVSKDKQVWVRASSQDVSRREKNTLQPDTGMPQTRKQTDAEGKTQTLYTPGYNSSQIECSDS